ncbi:TrbI/VirB10 family protein [Paraburkholderia humisilvae]|uniref:Type IV secretion system protein virB10 n=1 Tax=Paraburkholderia humisilvae TaxID=627669 RepID=A0A6J5F5C9_9BURK|nr:TrbI/VirB10 family protein [Paraburkholderia humisilvae]CAB3773563.1 hypothetical protein LMG29542_07317 [Paraburkholderia humisilvae]
MTDKIRKREEDREAAVREWERGGSASLVANHRKKKLNGISIAIIAIAVLGTVGYTKHRVSESADKTVSSGNLTIPERQPVPRLKNLEPASQAGGASAAGAVSARVTQGDDLINAKRERKEMQRQERERYMREERMKPAIIPPNTVNPPPATLQPVDGGNEQDPPHAGIFGDASGDRGADNPNSRFAREVSRSGAALSWANQIDNLFYKVLQGKMIEAVLEPRAISDHLPGMVCATVQRDVYGTEGRSTLSPWGARACGTYNAELRKGQGGLFVIQHSVRTPDGAHAALDSTGADELGTAGMGSVVNSDFVEIFGMSALLSIIGAGATNAGMSSGDQYNSATYYRRSVQQAVAQTSQSSFEKSQVSDSA